jgi:hypothetical protein
MWMFVHVVLFNLFVSSVYGVLVLALVVALCPRAFVNVCGCLCSCLHACLLACLPVLPPFCYACILPVCMLCVWAIGGWVVVGVGVCGSVLCAVCCGCVGAHFFVCSCTCPPTSRHYITRDTAVVHEPDPSSTIHGVSPHVQCVHSATTNARTSTP